MRGVGGDVIYCEEAAYMDLGVFYEVIVPLMEVRGTATICISTPLGSWNFYSELTEVRNEKGERLFNVIKVGMICERCKGAGKEDQCNHHSEHRPDWKPIESLEKMRAIFGNKKTLLMREVMGQITDDENMAFPAEKLKRLFNSKPVHEPHNHVTEVFVAVDPNGGASLEQGTGSETAIVSFYFDGANVVVSYSKYQGQIRGIEFATKRCRRCVNAVQ